MKKPNAKVVTVPTIFEICRPRADVLSRSFTDADFAADLASVVRDLGRGEYGQPVRFFANTYPTQGLRDLLMNVCSRLSGAGEEVASIFRLDTAYGGGKTHGLIALVHAAEGMQGVSNVREFVDSSLVPKGRVRVAAFDGENADPANGRAMGQGIKAHTPWGEIAYSLAGVEGYRRLERSDRAGQAPGAETLQALFGEEPALILLDELSVYLRKVERVEGAGAQLAAFLSSLIKAVESAPRAALVYTLAIGKDGQAQDAYRKENERIAEHMAEVESVSARKATLLNPTREEETVHVLRRRLFESIDEVKADQVIAAYRKKWSASAQSLPADLDVAAAAEAFRLSYPLHPQVLETLTGKTATLSNFQRVRGMLRLLVRTIARLWDVKPADATAIHVHHIDPGFRPIRQEIVTRLGQQHFLPAIENDIAGGGAKKALAQALDMQHHHGMPPLVEYVARTAFVHTLAFNDRLKGVAPDWLRFSMLCPAMDAGFIEEARRKFIAESAYLDDRPGAPLRFLAEANLQQIIRRETELADAVEARARLNDRIREVFKGKNFELVFFPGGPYEVPDDVGSGKPRLVVVSYDGLSVGASVDRVPTLVRQIYLTKGSQGAATRMLRNNLVFVLASAAHKEDMRRQMHRRLALQGLATADRLKEFESYQQDKIRELEKRSALEVSTAIQQCYRHVFYPSRASLEPGAVLLAHTAIDVPSTSDRPGAGQRFIVRALRDLSKLRSEGDQPDSPAYIRDKTPLRKGQITTAALRAEFRQNPDLPILLGEDVFIRSIIQGIERKEFVYRSGALLWGPGDPLASIHVDERSQIFTIEYAKSHEIWPRPKPPPPPLPPPPLPPPPPPPGGRTVAAEGLLQEALLKVWELAHRKGMTAIGKITISVYDALGGLGLMGSLGAIAGAKKVVVIDGGYETQEGGSFEMKFRGSIADAGPVKDFLMPELRAAKERRVDVIFELAFSDRLSVEGAVAEKLAQRLTRFSGGATSAHVTVEEKE